MQPITINISKTLLSQSDLIAIPRKDYEEFLSLKKIVSIFKPTKAELKAVERGERAIRQGKFKPWSQVKNELVNLRRKSRAETIAKN